MNRQSFEQIYVNYKEKTYPEDTTESVRRCYKSYDQKDKAIEHASQYRKLSVKEATEDVIDFFNCLKRCYSGYDYFLSDEKSDDIQRAVIKKIRFRIGRISNRKLSRLLYKALKDILADSHFWIYVSNREYHFHKKYIAYVSDIVVREADKGYEVINDNPFFEKGSVLTASDTEKYLMPTIYIADHIGRNDRCYLLGSYSDTEIKEIVISGRSVAAHRILSDQSTQNGEDRLVHKNGYVVANHASYDLPWDESLMKEYYNDGVCCSKADNVILNLAGNPGGSSAYPDHFYNGLCSVSDNGFLEAALPTPDEINDGVKKYTITLSTPDAGDKSTYNGNLYVVMNKATASSAEMGISPAYNIKNAILAGTGSYGCSNFGECLSYQLPNSGIMFSCGHKLFHHDKFDEGKGFLPDYWIDDKDPVAVIERYIENSLRDE